VALQIVSPLRARPTPEMIVRRLVSLYHLLLLYRVLAVIAAVATVSMAVPRLSFGQAIPAASHPQALGVLQFVGSQPNHGPWLYGLNASAEVKSVHFWGIRGDVSGQHWNSYATRYFAGLGPQVYFRHGYIVLHADALEGVSRNRMWVPPSPPADALSPAGSHGHHGYFSEPQTNFAVRAGGGIDAHLSDRWLFRIAEVTVTNSFATRTSHTVTYSDGIAFVF
jgi:hypothetical protein